MQINKKSNKLIRYLILVFCLLFLVAFVFAIDQIYSPQNFLSNEKENIIIQKGQSLMDISSQLENKNIITHRFWFNLYVILTNSQGKLQAGEYIFNNYESLADIARKIINGEVKKEIITIPEGWNIRDIAWYFENRGMFQAEELFELIGFPLIDYSKTTDLPTPRDFSQEYDFLKDKPENLNLEGYLFPDTYHIDPASDIEGIVKKTLDNFDKKLEQQLRDQIKMQQKTIFKIITMASLIEKEVITYKDKQTVSGILWKRLINGMALQVDATISYITGKKSTKVSKIETQIDSPYNTYKYAGLPQGPISNPGLESINAAIYPISSDFWYYLSTPEGETIFSKNLEEHNIAKAKYLK
jgi:UPF0755 protein